MGMQESLVILSLLVGVGIATTILYSILSRKKEKISRPFTLAILSTIIWSIGYIIEILTPSYSWKILAAKSEYVGIAILPAAWFVFSSRYARHFHKITETKYIYSLFLIPFITIFLVFTNEYHHLVWRSIQLFGIGNLKIITPEYGTWFWIHAIYSYATFLIGSLLLIAESLKFSRTHRKKSFTLILASSLPIITSTVYVSRIYPFDLTPLSFSLSMILLFLCVYKLKLIGIVPLARDKIVEDMDDIVMVFDSNKRLVDLNRSAQKTLSASKEELIGKEAEYVISMCPEINELIYGGKKQKMCEKFGKFFDVRVTPLRDEGNIEVGRILIARDITDLRRYQSELENLNKNLEIEVKRRTEYIQKLLDQKNDFIEQLGHDLKTPLTPILSLLPLIRERVKDEDTIKLVDVVLRNANYIKNLVIETLKLAKLNSPDIKFDIEKVKLSDVVEESIKENEITMKQKNIQPINRIDEDIFVKADRLRLKEVLTNLVSNSVKYTSEGGKIEFLARPNGDNIVVEIRDTGIGLEGDQKQKIFDEFYKVDESRHDVRSSGLGLSICKKIIEKHGGKIWAESKGIGKGISIYFALPGGKENKKSDEIISISKSL
ncbi:MAG: PAS domain S-box protein [Thermoplasmata archaeon]|nr:MAG: PAS domain S-box protein [Thermoplasmata archaeon]